MLAQELNTDAGALPERIVFSVERWLNYFEQNKEDRVPVSFPNGLKVSESLRLPLIRSLKKFQIGETGEGKHLRRFASKVGDETYERCIDLFIKEEQSHARILAEIIAALDGTLLTWHWTDFVFIALRRMLGLKTELFILLIAEIIGKCFYQQCADKLDDERACNVFTLIVLDEIAHLEFHCSFLQLQLQRLPRLFRTGILTAWAAVFFAAVTVFVMDHGAALAELGVGRKEFMAQCARNFHRAAVRSGLF